MALCSTADVLIGLNKTDPTGKYDLLRRSVESAIKQYCNWPIEGVTNWTSYYDGFNQQYLMLREPFVSNIEGIIERFKKQIEAIRDSAEDDEDRKKAKNLLKKLQRVLWGDETLKITLEDPSGNSGFVTQK